MRLSIIVAAAVVAAGAAHAEGASTPSPLAKSNFCIVGHNILLSKVAKDERSITFHMNDGKTYVTTFQAPCFGLSHEGYVHVAHSGDDICSGEVIKVRHFHSVCVLGEFAHD